MNSKEFAQKVNGFCNEQNRAARAGGKKALYLPVFSEESAHYVAEIYRNGEKKYVVRAGKNKSEVSIDAVRGKAWEGMDRKRHTGIRRFIVDAQPAAAMA